MLDLTIVVIFIRRNIEFLSSSVSFKFFETSLFVHDIIILLFPEISFVLKTRFHYYPRFAKLLVSLELKFSIVSSKAVY